MYAQLGDKTRIEKEAIEKKLKNSTTRENRNKKRLAELEANQGKWKQSAWQEEHEKVTKAIGVHAAKRAQYQKEFDDIMPVYAVLVQAWIDSPGHRANILNPNFTEIGIGYELLEDDTGNVNYFHYWTQLFGTEF